MLKSKTRRRWVMDAHAPDYEPLQSATIGARAAAAGVRPAGDPDFV